MLNVSALALNNSTYKRQAFSSIKLADVHVKKVDENGKETLIPAHFTMLDLRNSAEDKKAIKSILKKWDNPEINRLLKNTVGNMNEIFAIEVPSEGTALEDKIVNISAKYDFNNNVYIKGIVTKPEHIDKTNEKRKLKHCGKVMMAMLAKQAKENGYDSLTAYSLPRVLKFYEKINMSRIDPNRNSFYFKPENMEEFIKKMDKEYKLGELNEPA